jgi:hypothetical protein
MYVKGFYVADGSGSREAEVVNHLAVPRRTVRDGLGRLVGWGALVRDDSGLYYPSAVFDHWPVERFERILDRVLRLADTALVLRDAIAAARPAARN